MAVRLSLCCLALLALCFITCSDQSVPPFVLRCPDTPLIRTGEATHYTFASGAGSCSFDSTLDDLMVGAMNIIDYNGSQLCGARLRVTGPNGTILIRVVDLCPECPKGNIDLSPSAFSRIADTSLGRVPVRWQIVPYDSIGPIQYHFQDSSMRYWTAVQLRSHRYPVYSLEYVTPQGKFAGVSRAHYNYFVQPNGMGAGPYTFRVTDIYGHVLVDSVIVHTPGRSVPGREQFPICEADVLRNEN